MGVYPILAAAAASVLGQHDLNTIAEIVKRLSKKFQIDIHNPEIYRVEATSEYAFVVVVDEERLIVRILDEWKTLSFDEMYSCIESELEKQMETKKRRRIVKPPSPGKARTIKKPTCPIHKTSAMVFDMLTQKWRCVQPNCKMVARPKEDQNDKSVKLGSGKVSMRLIFMDDENLRLLLLSEDLVGLDVTDAFNGNFDTLLAFPDINRAIEEAKENGLTEITLNESQLLMIKVPVTVMGIR